LATYCDRDETIQRSTLESVPAAAGPAFRSTC
jgi:hypothetical protein